MSDPVAGVRRVVAKSPIARLPPGQMVTRKWPVLHYSHIPRIDTNEWRYEQQQHRYTTLYKVS